MQVLWRVFWHDGRRRRKARALPPHQALALAREIRRTGCPVWIKAQ